MSFLKNEKGITLLEVVISLVLIGVILISFFSIMIQSNKVNRYSADTVDLTYEAQNTMETIYNSIRKSGNITTFINQSEITNNYTISPTSCATVEPINCTLTNKTDPKIKVKLEQMPSSNNLIRVITTISHGTYNDVVMESVWRWN